MEHEHAHIFRAIADDKDVKLQCSFNVDPSWESIGATEALKLILHRCNYLIRLVPKTIRIGDMDVPMPMRVAPAIGTDYWVAGISGIHSVYLDVWSGDSLDLMYLKRNLCHLKEAACRTHAEALIKASGGVL